MLHFNSLAIGLLAVISIAPTAQAVTPIATSAAIGQPAANLHADAAIIFGIKFPTPQSQPVIIETPRYPEPIYREVSRGHHQQFSKHGHHHGNQVEYRQHHDNHNYNHRENHHEDRHENRHEH